MKDFVFVSGNQGKVKLLEFLLGQKVDHHALDLPEIQSLDIEEIIEAKARAAFEVLKTPVLIDDASLSADAMGGLPGTLVKYFLASVGAEGICKMVDSFDDRAATAQTAFMYFDGKQMHKFIGKVAGTISDRPREGSSEILGMGWNSIFIPRGQTQTLAEMGEGKFEQHTPRAQAVKKLKKFLAQT